MSFEQHYFDLNNGNKIPAVSVLGTGTKWFKTDESKFSNELTALLTKGLDTLPGIVHIDNAEVYQTYPESGAALKATTRPRDKFWITDKFSVTPGKPGFHPNPVESLQVSLEKQGLEYVDLYLLHSPFMTKEIHGFDVQEAWAYMEELYRLGKARNIGVSNFAVEDLEKVLQVATVKPQVNQIEFNAFLQNQTPGVYDFCRKNDILLEAYSPLAPLQKKEQVLASNPETAEFYDYVSELAAKYAKSEASILLNWVAKMYVLPITTSSKFERISDAQHVYEFELTNDEVEKIKQLGAKQHLRLYWRDQYEK